MNYQILPFCLMSCRNFETLAQVSCDFCEIFKHTFIIETLRFLLYESVYPSILFVSCDFLISHFYAYLFLYKINCSAQPWLSILRSSIFVGLSFRKFITFSIMFLVLESSMNLRRVAGCWGCNLGFTRKAASNIRNVSERMLLQ